MITIKKEMAQNIPVLHAVCEQKQNEKLPVIFFFHGFESIKERNVQYAYMLAEKGYRVILPEALYHGERAVEGKDLSSSFWEIVIRSIHELALIKDWYAEQNLIDVNRIGAAGTSMGAITTLGAIAKYDWISVAVSLMGDPSYVNFAKYQLHLLKKQGTVLPFTQEQEKQMLQALEKYQASSYIDSWKPRPLLFWHGKQDQVVPYPSSYQFYQQLIEKYNEKDVPISYLLDEKYGHNVPNYGVIETVNWFSKYL